jgi:hypothetical protein
MPGGHSASAQVSVHLALKDGGTAALIADVQKCHQRVLHAT